MEVYGTMGADVEALGPPRGLYIIDRSSLAHFKLVCGNIGAIMRYYLDLSSYRPTSILLQ